MTNSIKEQNERQFDKLRALNLPLGQYAVTASGPLGVRGLRAIGDVDIVVSNSLWEQLAAQYGISEEDNVKKIVIGDSVEALGKGSFYHQAPGEPLLAHRIASAELIDGLPFEALEHVLFYKRKMGRDKDLRDIALIEEWQRQSYG